MKVLIVDIDSKIPNLALMKLSAHYKKQGHEVGFHVKDPDLIHVSCIFQKNKEQALGLKQFYPDSEIIFGGSGINYNVLDPRIEFIKPDYDLYPSTYSQGYTTRGCVKRCPFCIVHDKEGKLTRHQHIKEFYDERFDRVMLMDNNILADKEWFFEQTDFILENDLKILEHGMDIHYLDKEIAERLSELKFAKTIHFAFDKMEDKKAVLHGIQLLKDAEINLKQNVQFYVLVGYNTSHKEDLYRCNLLKKEGTNAFVMPYQKDKFISKLARWSNRKHLYWSCEFKEFVKGEIV